MELVAGIDCLYSSLGEMRDPGETRDRETFQSSHFHLFIWTCSVPLFLGVFFFLVIFASEVSFVPW